MFGELLVIGVFCGCSYLMWGYKLGYLGVLNGGYVLLCFICYFRLFFLNSYYLRKEVVIDVEEDCVLVLIFIVLFFFGWMVVVLIIGVGNVWFFFGGSC